MLIKIKKKKKNQLLYMHVINNNTLDVMLIIKSETGTLYNYIHVHLNVHNSIIQYYYVHVHIPAYIFCKRWLIL